MPNIKNICLTTRWSNTHISWREFTGAHHQATEAAEAAVQWVLREYYRRALALMLSDSKLSLLVSHSVTGLPSAALQRIAAQPSRKGPPWKAYADRHIHQAAQQARKRLPTKAPESDIFRAEVQSWMKRAMNEQAQAEFLAEVAAIGT